MRVLVTGGAGFLGTELIWQLGRAGHEVVATWHRSPGSAPATEWRQIDLTSTDSLGDLTRDSAAVIHTAYKKPGEGSIGMNVDASAALAAASHLSGARFIHLSTDAVFAGDDAPYQETDAPGPIHQYGREKYHGEVAVKATNPDATIVRTSLLYDLIGRSPHEQAVIGTTTDSDICFFVDEFRTPVHVTDLATAIIGLFDIDAPPVIHLAGSERLSRFEFARALAPALNMDPSVIRPGTDDGSHGPRPKDVTLDISLARQLLGFDPRTILPI